MHSVKFLQAGFFGTFSEARGTGKRNPLARIIKTDFGTARGKINHASDGGRQFIEDRLHHLIYKT